MNDTANNAMIPAFLQNFLAWAHVCLVLLLVSFLGLANTAGAVERITYFHNDVSGTPLLATDATGNVLWKENYRPYGEKLNNPPAAADNRLGFAGKPYDEATGLSYMGARYYDPALGRFMGIDPKEVDVDEVHGFNRYAYANNNPYKFVDPDGHSPLDVVFLLYDFGKLGHAIYKGEGVGDALQDVAWSVVGVASPVPGAGQAIKAVRAAEHAVDVAKVAGALATGARGAERAAEAAKGAGKAFKDFNQARNTAVQWLEGRGFKAEQETLGKFGDKAGKPIGMKSADGKSGFRVEFDDKHGAHINVWSGKQKDTFLFEGNQSMVDQIVKQFVKEKR